MPKIKPRVPMGEQPPLQRIKNFKSVPYGYTEDEAVEEATRCIQCKKPKCEPACPVNIGIKEMNLLIAQRKFKEAYLLVKVDNSFPACSGRVCPQEKQCEGDCILKKFDEPIAIGKLEAFIANWGAKHKVEVEETVANNEDKHVAIVGSGPAGLACAAECRKYGYAVTIYETLHKAGGVLQYGIPEFRLPKDIVDAEVKKLEEMGVKIELNHTVGQNIYYYELVSQNDAVFLAMGAGAPKFMGIAGENPLDGVYSSNEFLIRANLMKAYKFPEWDTPIDVGKKVAVLGAGNVAMDAARTALRLGAEEVHIIYRRTKEYAPARAEELHHALEEGVIFHELVNPVRFHGNDEGFIDYMELVKMELIEDKKGKLRPTPIVDSNFYMGIDTVIEALGTVPNRLFLDRAPEIKRDKNGVIIVDENHMTSVEGTFAGGDAASGAATVIKALGEGKNAAKSIHAYISSHDD
ncbi:MAG: NADPH-dependent glutamate synthase [Sulfurospirillum sp.]